jgi:hypothetical protein
MREGDVVRVTNKNYPDSAIEGVVMSVYVIGTHKEIKIKYLGNYHTFNDNDYDVAVIRRVEPKTIGSTITLDRTYTRFSVQDEREFCWISENGVLYSWDMLTDLSQNVTKP